MGEEARITKEALASLINISEGINNQSGQVFVGNQIFNASNISFAPKRKRSDDDFKHFNLHYEVPNNISTHFTGRLDILEEMNRQMLPCGDGNGLPKSQRRFVLYGLGGSGKTQIAMKFAEENRERFWGIFWIDATNDSTAERSLVDIAKIARLEDQNPTAAKKWLTNLAKPWLLIFDNADDPSMRLPRHFPAGNRGVILITTRNPDEKHLATGWREVNVMSEVEAIELLLKGVSSVHSSPEHNTDTIDAAKRVVQTLGYIPLAIAQAAGAIRQGICSIEQYCEVFSKKRKYLMSRRGGDDSSNYNYTAYASWEISANFLEARADDVAVYALNILNLLSCMHYVGLSEEMFEIARVAISLNEYDWTLTHVLERINSGYRFETSVELLKLLFKGWGPGEHDDHEPKLPNSYGTKLSPLFFREAVSLLSSFSLIQCDVSKEGYIISMHPTVHFWVKDRLPADIQQKWHRIATQFLDFATGSPRMGDTAITDEFGHIFTFTWVSYRRTLIPHIEALLSLVNISMICSWDPEADIVNNIVSVLRENEEFEKCMDLLNPAIEFYERKLGKTHLNTVHLLKIRALVYLQMGRSDEGLGFLINLLRVLDGPELICREHQKQAQLWISMNLSLVIGKELVYRSIREHSKSIEEFDVPPLNAVALDLREALMVYNSILLPEQQDPVETSSIPGPVLSILEYQLAGLLILSGELREAFGILGRIMKRAADEFTEAGLGRAHSYVRAMILSTISMYMWDDCNVGHGRALALMKIAVGFCEKWMGPDNEFTLRNIKCLALMEESKAIPMELWVDRFMWF